jgi:dTDP-4-dehydrorhamnose reductase
MLAEVTTQVLAMGRKDPVEWIKETAGLYHLAGDGGTSRYQFAMEILRLDPQRGQQVATEILEAKTSDFPTPALRPLNAILDCTKFKSRFGISLPPWQEALELMLIR